MKILLTDEEIKDGIGKEYDRRYPLTRSSLSDLDCYEAVAKAQLKKVVEFLVENDVLCPRKEAYEDNCITCKNFYEALLKEVEDV